MTKKAGYTPGPWHLDLEKFWDKVIRIEANGGEWERLYVEVSRDDCDTETAEANAKLIAQSPRMVEALLYAKELIDEQNKRFHIGCCCQWCESLPMKIDDVLRDAGVIG